MNFLDTYGKSDLDEVINDDSVFVLPSIIKYIIHGENCLIANKLIVPLIIDIT
jgi:hypothetical protein